MITERIDCHIAEAAARFISCNSPSRSSVEKAEAAVRDQIALLEIEHGHDAVYEGLVNLAVYHVVSELERKEHIEAEIIAAMQDSEMPQSSSESE